MGIVFRARDVELGRDVAYKVMKADFGDAEGFRRWFAREAEITARLRFPGIVPVFGMVTDDSELPAYAMAYIEGKNFGDLAREPSASREWLASFVTACRIVEHAHKMGFIHGDISLKNLMIDDEGATHVVDWGLARHVDPDDPSNRIDGSTRPGPEKRGTPGFVSPRVEDGHPKTFVTDVYSLGAVLSVLASGATPEDRLDLAGPGRPAVPRRLRAIIKAATDGREGGLYRNAGHLADDVQRYLDGEPVRADREPAWETAWRAVRRNPAKATAVIASVLILAIASAAREHLARGEEETRSARREAGWSEANSAMLRSEAILSQYPASELMPRSTIDLMLNFVSVKGMKPNSPSEAAESMRFMDQAARKNKQRAESDRREAAVPELLKAVAILERLEPELPDPRSLRFQLAKSYYMIGVLELTRATAEVGFLRSLWIMRMNFAGTPTPQPRVEAALAKVVKAQDYLPNTLPDPPDSVSLREFESWNWMTRGIALGQLGRFTECRMSFDRALSLADGPSTVAIQKILPLLLKAAEAEQSHMPWSGPAHVDHAKAIHMANYISEQSGTSPEAIFNAACAFSLAARDSAAHEAEQEQLARRAIALFTRIGKVGYFRNPKKLDELRTTDDALEPLRQRADFLALVAEVSKGR